ncbi:NAD(P)/FAD-dependent oxidoreductase [Kistimonas scapharcae]|uniref:NAD(P)/FAD-dependent oxidoreductase n=1 Tax=Kistimonas scapharcae TaxID=1036133 RepID=A0ABP8V7D4_9GAMM
MEKVDTVIIGAGVIGLAIARQLARPGKSVFVLEQHDRFGEETSSRNSEVIHAGIYYPSGSLKAFLCVRGKALLYNYCEQHRIPCRRTGKLIVATTAAETGQLKHIYSHAAANGVRDLQWLSQEKLKEKEPAVTGIAALFSPSTGIIDSHTYMQTLLMEATQNDAELVTGTRVLSMSCNNVQDGFLVTAVTNGETYQFHSRTLINAAGLGAQQIATDLPGKTPIPPLYYCKGHYYSLQGSCQPFRHLVYPVPEQNTTGLGIHATLDLAGNTRFGPDTAYIDTVDYRMSAEAPESWYAAIRRYWPALPDGALQPDYSGIRPKLQQAGEASQDFVIQGHETHGLPGLIHLFGIESPGLTASLALAGYVESLLEGQDPREHLQ